MSSKLHKNLRGLCICYVKKFTLWIRWKVNWRILMNSLPLWHHLQGREVHWRYDCPVEADNHFQPKESIVRFLATPSTSRILSGASTWKIGPLPSACGRRDWRDGAAGQQEMSRATAWRYDAGAGPIALWGGFFELQRTDGSIEVRTRKLDLVHR